MSEAPQPGAYEIVCPHCGKTFQGELLGAGDDPQRGFKCPHCRLFVPYDRADIEPVEG